MSKFRDALKQHFENNEINVVQLSHQCGIDRTTIQHMIGNRKHYNLPSSVLLKIVLEHLRMTPSERKHIEDLFLIEKIGLHNYLGRKYVKDIIGQIASLHNFSEPGRKPLGNIRVEIDSSNFIYDGANAINSLIYFVCAEEIELNVEPRVSLNIPFSYSFLKQMLLQLYWELEGRLTIEHMVMLSQSPKTNVNPNINLEATSNILPFAFCGGDGYHAKYYYTGLDPENELLLAMPYYLITSTRLVLLSGDYMSAILIKDLDIIEQYRKMFKKSYRKCQSLTQHIDSPLNIFDAYSDCMNGGCQAYSLETHPCFFQYLTPEIIERTACRELPCIYDIIAGFVEYVANFKRMNIVDYFTIAGLETFASTGKLVALSAVHANPLSVLDRISVLESAYEQIEAGGKSRLLDSSKITLSEHAIISTINNDSLQFFYEEHGLFHYCIIKEASIVGAFVDFFESLPQSDMIFSAEETLSVLRNCINILKKI